MIALGYDYGTTNSLIVRFDYNITRGDIRKRCKSTRMPDGQSPKRLLNHSKIDNTAVLDRIREFSKSMFGEVNNYLPDEKVVVTLTIPNTFRDVECLQMRDAVVGACCNPDVFGSRLCPSDLHVLPEPIAAALYYVYIAGDCITGQNKRYLIVYDVGGGTSDFAVISYKINKNSEGKKVISFSVKCTTGELILGGEDFDALTEEYMANYLEYNVGMCMRSEIKDALRRDREAVKCCVSARNYTHDLRVNNEPVVEKGLRLERQIFEARLRNSGKLKLFTDSAKQLYDAFKKEIEKEGGDFAVALASSDILPVGGSSKIPLLQNEMERIFKGCHVIDEDEFGEDARFESVSRGAAIYSGWKAGMLDDIASVEIENRVLHRISYMWGNNQLKTCVEKNFPSGDYPIKLRPSGLQVRSDGSFIIGQVHFYEGEGDFVDQSGARRNDPIRTLADKLRALNDPIYLNGRLLNDVVVTMNLKIKEGRLHSVEFTVPQGCKDRSDYYSGAISIQ